MNSKLVLLALISFAALAAASDGFFRYEDCMTCDNAYGGTGFSAGETRCLITDLSPPAERTSEWDAASPLNKFVGTTYSVTNPCYSSLARPDGDFDLTVRNQVLNFVNSSLTLHFRNLNVSSTGTPTALIGTSLSCSSAGKLNLIVQDLVYVSAHAMLGNNCGNLTIEADNVVVEGSLIASGDLEIRANRVTFATTSSLKAGGKVKIMRRTEGGGAGALSSFLGTISVGNGLTSAACALLEVEPNENQYGFFLDLANSDVKFGPSTAKFVQCDVKIKAKDVNILSEPFIVGNGRLSIEAADTKISSNVSSKYSLLLNLSGSLNLASSGSLKSTSHWVAVYARGTAKSVLDGVIEATNRRPDLPYASHLPIEGGPTMYNDAVFLEFTSDAEMHGKILSHSGSTEAGAGFTVRNSTIETNFFNPAVYVNLSKPTKSETSGATTYTYNTNSSNYWTVLDSNGDGVPDGFETDTLKTEFIDFNAYNNSDASLGLFTILGGYTVLLHTPRPKNYSYPATGEAINIYLYLKDPSIVDESTCGDNLAKLVLNGTFYLALNETPGNVASSRYNITYGQMLSNGTGWCQFLAWFSNDPPSIPIEPQLYRKLVSGVKYYFKVKACWPGTTNCAETKQYSFIFNASPMSVGAVVLSKPNRVSNDFAFSAKIEHLTSDDVAGRDDRVGSASAGILFRVEGASGKAYLLKLNNLGTGGNKTLELRRCASTNANFFTGTTPTPGGSLCANEVSGWILLKNSSAIGEEVTVPPRYPFAQIPSGLKSYYLKIEVRGCNFKAYWSQDENFEGHAPAIDYIAAPVNCSPSGSVGFWSMDSRTRFSDIKFFERDPRNASADIAIRANELAFKEADIRADYKLAGLIPYAGSGGKLWIAANNVIISPLGDPSLCLSVTPNTCTGLTPFQNPDLPLNQGCRPYFYTNPCDPSSLFLWTTCNTNWAGIERNSSRHLARAPVDFAMETFCAVPTRVAFYGVVKDASLARIASGSIWVEAIRDARGIALNVSSLLESGMISPLQRKWSASFSNGIREGLSKLTLGDNRNPDAINPRLFLNPFSVYYLDVWVSDNPSDGWSFPQTVVAKRHRYTIALRT
ncbi:hypothetical protein H0O03_02975 [Candidatus Micrarchaeota archaeon]|nr:hypothetical protein [Candidatus Micrarchaeota archaeon]